MDPSPDLEERASENGPRPQRQVLQVFVEQVGQLVDEDFKRLPPPPMPNEESIF